MLCKNARRNKLKLFIHFYVHSFWKIWHKCGSSVFFIRHNDFQGAPLLSVTSVRHHHLSHTEIQSSFVPKTGRTLSPLLPPPRPPPTHTHTLVSSHVKQIEGSDRDNKPFKQTRLRTISNKQCKQNLLKQPRGC